MEIGNEELYDENYLGINMIQELKLAIDSIFAFHTDNFPDNHNFNGFWSIEIQDKKPEDNLGIPKARLGFSL